MLSTVKNGVCRGLPVAKLDPVLGPPKGVEVAAGGFVWVGDSDKTPEDVFDLASVPNKVTVWLAIDAQPHALMAGVMLLKERIYL